MDKSFLLGVVVVLLICFLVYKAGYVVLASDSKNCKLFDRDFYVNNNPDLKIVYSNNKPGAFDHFISHGIHEGRSGNSNFSQKQYRLDHPELAKARNIDVYDHFATNLCK